VGSAVISGEIEQLEGELAELRARADHDASSFASLQGEIESLKQRLNATQDAVRRNEAALAEKQAELVEAQRLERLASYDEDLAQYREARDRVEQAADRFLAEVEAYDREAMRIRKLRAEMLDAFGNGDRIADVDEAIDEDANGLATSWKAVAGAAELRLRAGSRSTPATAPNPSATNGAEHEANGTPPDEGRAARILEYFSKD
jgi:chromosome segregation ATPase